MELNFELIFFSGTVNFNHRYGCQKCMVQGEFFNRMSFHRIAVTNDEREREMRTDERFRQRYQPEHHVQRSVLEDLPIDMVVQIPVADSLHLIDLGVMKRLEKLLHYIFHTNCIQLIYFIVFSSRYLYKWMGHIKSIPRLWSINQIEEVSKEILQFNETLPHEIHRKIRSLKHVHFWKASEFRTMILYVGVVGLKDNVPKQEYELFLKVFCAVVICSSKMYASYLPLARTLFAEYIEGHITIYGLNSITSNIHNLIHVVDDVERFGDLNSISAYEFENCLHLIKLLLKQCNKPLEQLARRLHENSLTVLENQNNRNTLFPKFKDQFLLGYGTENCLAYRRIELKNIMLRDDKKNQWVMLNDNDRTIVRFEYAFQRESNSYFSGYPLNKALKENFFTRPFNSSHINIFLYKIEENDSKIFNVNSIMAKLFCLPYHDKFVFIPLLHSL